MKTPETNRGIGAIAVIAILAVIAIGGVATVSYMQRADVNMSDTEMQGEEEMMNAKNDAREDLLGLKATLGGSVDVDATLQALAQIRSDLTDAYASADAEVQTEMRALENRFDTLEAEIRAQSDSAQSTIDEIVASLDAEIDANIDARDEDSDGDGLLDGDEEMNDDSGVDASATTSVDADVSADNDGAGASGEAQGSGSLEVH